MDLYLEKRPFLTLFWGGQNWPKLTIFHHFSGKSLCDEKTHPYAFIDHYVYRSCGTSTSKLANVCECVILITFNYTLYSLPSGRYVGRIRIERVNKCVWVGFLVAQRL